MTPRQADWRSVRPKLRKIEELLALLDTFRPHDGTDLHADPVRELAAERVLTLVVELAFAVNSHLAVALLARAPDTYAESFDLIGRTGVVDRELATSLRPSAGLRNVLVHAYLEIDPARVGAAVPLAIRGYTEYVRQVAAWFVARGDAR